MEDVELIKPIKKANISNELQLGSIFNVHKSENESNSEKSSNVSSARSSKHSIKKSASDDNSKSNVNIRGNSNGKQKHSKTSSMSDNSTSIDEELSCEIAIVHSSDDDEDPVPNIIKEYLGDVISLKTKASLNSSNNNNNNNNNITQVNEDNSKNSSKSDNRKKDSENQINERLSKSLSPIIVSSNQNANLQAKSRQFSSKKQNFRKSNYLDLKLTLVKKESIADASLVHSSTISRPRTASSLPRRYVHKNPQEKEVGKYPYSLKLLGVQIPDDASTGARQSRAFRSASSQSWADTPAKVQTRVKRRSVSLDDVKRVIPMIKDPTHLKSTFLNEHQRAVLNQAIYEEWYDIRGKEIKRKKLKEKEEKEMQDERKKLTEEDRKRRNEEVYSRWKKEKAMTTKDKKPPENKTNSGKGESEIKYSDSSAFESWKEKKYSKTAEKLKEKLEKEKEKQMRTIAEKEEQMRKREEADKAFEAWLRMKKEKLKRQWLELQDHKLKLQEEEHTRRHEAEIAYNYWKKKKEVEKNAKLNYGTL